MLAPAIRGQGEPSFNAPNPRAAALAAPGLEASASDAPPRRHRYLQTSALKVAAMQRHGRGHDGYVDLAYGCEAPFGVVFSAVRERDALRLRCVEHDAGATDIVRLHQGVWVPCRKCDFCGLRRKRQWVARMLCEVMKSEQTWFVTITAPFGRLGIPQDDAPRWMGRRLQLGMKLLRQKVARARGTLVRFVGVAEPHTGGGKNHGFPHWHLLVHAQRAEGSPLPARILEDEVRQAFRSIGRTSVQPLREAEDRSGVLKAARYLAKYLTKTDCAVSRIRPSMRYGAPPDEIRTERDVKVAAEWKAICEAQAEGKRRPAVQPEWLMTLREVAASIGSQAEASGAAGATGPPEWKGPPLTAWQGLRGRWSGSDQSKQWWEVIAPGRGYAANPASKLFELLAAERGQSVPASAKHHGRKQPGEGPKGAARESVASDGD